MPAAVVSAIDAPKIHASIETTIHTSNPANDLVAASPGTVAAPQRSLFQTDSLALKFVMDAAWARRWRRVDSKYQLVRGHHAEEVHRRKAEQIIAESPSITFAH